MRCFTSPPVVTRPSLILGKPARFHLNMKLLTDSGRLNVYGVARVYKWDDTPGFHDNFSAVTLSSSDGYLTVHPARTPRWRRWSVHRRGHRRSLFWPGRGSDVSHQLGRLYGGHLGALRGIGRRSQHRWDDLRKICVLPYFLISRLQASSFDLEMAKRYNNFTGLC